MKKVMPAGRQGFTLIELLVVIAIIGILVSVGAFAARQAQSSGRDARRQADLETIRSALEIFRSDCVEYPASLPTSGGILYGDGSPSTNCPTTQVYIQKTPTDPQGGSSYYYNRPTNGTYSLCAKLENAPSATPPAGTCGTNGCNGANCNYRVTNP